MQTRGLHQSLDLGAVDPYHDEKQDTISDRECETRQWVTFLRTGSPPAIAWLIPFGIAAVYLVVFVLQLPKNITEVAWISDYSSPFTTVETLARTGPGDHTILATSGQYVALWFGLLTARLPLHRELWEIIPSLAFIASALLIGWSVATVSSRRAGALAALLVLVASPKALVFLLAAVSHDIAYLSAALLGAYLIWLTRAEGRARSTTFTVPLLVGVALGACLGSDLLVGAVAVAPLAATGVLAGLRRSQLSRTVARSALLSAAVSVPVAVLTLSTMKAIGYQTMRTPIEWAKPSVLWVHTRLLFEGLKLLFNGYLADGSPGLLHPELGLGCEVAMSFALFALLAVGASTTVKFIRSRSPEKPEIPADIARSVHIIFWAASAVTACLAFWLTAETSTTVTHESYYASTLLSVAAIIPLLLGGRAFIRWLALAGCAIFFAGSLAGLTSNYVNMEVGLRAARYEPEVVRLAKANHVSVGYAGYWESSSFTWQSAGQVTVRPVLECSSPETVKLCPFLLERVTSWYTPQDRHSFLLVDSAESWLSQLPPGLGRPIANYSFGTVHMLIYPYDIASQFGPFPN